MADTKRCSRYKKEKPISEFTKNRHAKDGLDGYCKPCKKAYSKDYHAEKINYWTKKHRGRPVGSKNTRIAGDKKNYIGIDSMIQVDSILREMSELKFKIDTEKSLCNNRIEMVKKYTNELIEPDLAHQHNLYMMLKEFIKSKYKNGDIIDKSFRFGSIRFSEDKLDIELNTTLAENLLDKP